MCGILYAKRKKKFPIRKALMKRYKKQANRGKQGFGFIGVTDGVVTGVERFETEAEMERAMELCDANEILFHHRFPTSTPNHEDATHPIVVSNEELDSDFYVIHNGVLQNSLTLKKMHEEMGYEYNTIIKEIKIVQSKNTKTEDIKEVFNDSESLAIELARYFSGKSDSIDTVGSVAFICLETDKKGKIKFLHYGHNSGNPLVRETNGDIFFLKSIGDGEPVPIDQIYSINYKTGKGTHVDKRVGKTNYTDYSSYKGAMSDNWGDNYDNALAQQRKIGFGNPKDDERDTHRSLLGLPSPIKVKDGELEWEEDDLPFGKTLPTIDYSGVSDLETYQNSEEYLLDLWMEVENLQDDVLKCQSIMADPTKTGSEMYSEEYLIDAQSILEHKVKEAKDLEDLLASWGRY